MNKKQNLKTVAAVERERERERERVSLFNMEFVYSTTHTWGCLLENKEKANALQILNKGSTTLNL